MKKSSVRVVISGKVQGVYYRAWTVATALKLNICGWVRNKKDGTVEAVFSANPGIIEKMLKLCWQGSPASDVTNVEVFEYDGDVADGFVQREDA